jgi:cell division FtsZ-interacting protein ZapD
MQRETSKMTTAQVLALVGLPETEATTIIRDAGMQVRVMSKNGKFFMGCCDIDIQRVNLDIENDKVIKATIG